MNISFGKVFIICVATLAGVSCTVAPVHPPQPSAVPIERQEKITKIDQTPLPSKPSPLAEITEIDKPLIQYKPVLTPPPIVALLPTSLLSLRHTSAVPGGVAWITLPKQSATPPKILYQKRQVVVLRHGKKWVALVGVPLNAKVGSHSVIDQETRKRYSFKVKYKKYKTQHVRIKNKRKVNPNRKDLQRIRHEQKQIQAALSSYWQATSNSPLPLMQPVKGRFSSPFGLRRYFNGQRRSPHKGLDIAVPLGTPVVAAAPGKVVRTGHYFFTGKTVFIDHGQSVVTLYGHLNTIVVSPEQIVKTGQIIGTVGKTGRASGPHLHWGVSLNNTMIDPMLVKQ